MYTTPKEHFLRLHFERSRFNRHLEDMLLLLSERIVSMGIMGHKEFNDLLDKIIRSANPDDYAEKTIRNQRTEMIRLFGLVKYVDGLVVPGNRLVLLAQSQDIPRFFKSFCKQFQYPGGFLKPDRVSELVRAGVEFKPAQYILQLLKIASSKYGEFAINAEETTHFVFNDKRITVGKEHPSIVLDRIMEARNNNVELDKTSDVIRYARDFLKYMVEANLLNEFRGMYSINEGEKKAIHSIIADKDFFNGYSKVIKKDGSWDVQEYKDIDEKWAEWLSDMKEDPSLETPASALIKDDVNYPDQWKKVKELLAKKDTSLRRGALKEMGDEGEKIAFEYEKDCVSKIRPDMAHMVKLVSSTTMLGYDILSVDAAEGRRKKYIEVKTTKKNYEPEIPVPFFISINEWATAEQHGDDYFIYRVIITKTGITIFGIQNPVLKYKEGHLIVEPTGFKVVYSGASGKFFDL